MASLGNVIHDNKNDLSPFIVGIGASAGGIEAICEMVSNLSPSKGCVYVVLQHLPEKHTGQIISLIARNTSLQVLELDNDSNLVEDRIYVAPPGVNVVFEERKIRLIEADTSFGAPKPSIDLFLKTAAEAYADKCIAVILSGTGSDGAYGVVAVREAGGITIAQNTDSAKFNAMSNAAVATGCIDLVLPPHKIGQHLEKILKSSSYLPEKRNESTRISPFFNILQIVLAHTRVDFRDYKQTTIKRRIERRMKALGITQSEEYALHCRKDPREIDILFRDLLISVTRFFRDPDEFNDLKEPILELCETRRDHPLRIWIAGCATGEEVYSIAIQLAEAMGGPAQLVASKIQIFATDIDKSALQTARAGQYSPTSLLDVDPALAERYFIQSTDHVRVIDALTSVVLFSEHNICQDPPYIKMDLICCRNVLIYFGKKLQEKVISRLHYSLNPDGYLFLGSSETLSSTRQLFAPIASSPHIFCKREMEKTQALRAAPELSSTTALSSPDTSTSTDNIGMFDALAESLGQTALLVSNDFKLEKIYGEVGPTINLSKRHDVNLTLDVLGVALRQEARGLVSSAIKHKTRCIGVRHQSSDAERVITRLEAIPCRSIHSQERAALLVINRWNAESPDYSSGMDLPSEFFTSEYLQELDVELAKTRSALQQTIEKLEYSNQELQQLSEEMQLTNAELQSTNEELGASNEELQSTNEEMITVNEELQFNTTELESLTAEHASLLQVMPMPVLILDQSLHITQSSGVARELFELTPSLIRPHLSQIPLPSGYPNIVATSQRAIASEILIREPFTIDGAKNLLTCSPFADFSGNIIGATLIFEKA